MLSFAYKTPCPQVYHPLTTMTQTSDTDEPTPLHLEDLPRSELAEMIKVCKNSVYIVHLLTSALYQDLQIETSELHAELRCHAQEWASDIWPENPGKPRGIEGYKSSGERTKEE